MLDPKKCTDYEIFQYLDMLNHEVDEILEEAGAIFPKLIEDKRQRERALSIAHESDKYFAELELRYGETGAMNLFYDYLDSKRQEHVQ